MSRQREDTVRFFRCAECRTAYFPRRLACRVCGAERFEAFVPGQGCVEEVTRLADGVGIVSVLADGVRVVCSTPVDLAVGAEVRLVGDSRVAAAGGAAAVFLPQTATTENEDPA